MSLIMDILDRHVQLAMWAEHENSERFWASYLKSQAEEVPDYGDPNLINGYAESCAHMMGMAETYYVAPDICDIIEEAAPTVPREPLRSPMVPSRIGWCEFHRTISLGVDEHDEPWGVSGVSWRVEDGRNEELYGNLHVSTGGGIRWYDDQNVEHIGPGITIIWWRSRDDATLLGALPQVLSQFASAIPAQVTGWSFDIDWDNTDRKAFTLDEVGELQRKILLTTFNLLMDELVVVRKERPKRAALRRAVKALKSPDYGDVNVVDLRKLHVLNYEPPEVDDDAEPVHWTHRWIVRPHWRTLHRGTSKERHVYIRRHVKGPSNKPIVVKDRLSRLIR